MLRPCTLQICLLDMVSEPEALKDIIQVMLWPIAVNFKIGYSYLAMTKAKQLKYCYTSKSLAIENQTFRNKKDALEWIKTYQTPHQDDIQKPHDAEMFSESGLKFQRRVACFIWIEK